MFYSFIYFPKYLYVGLKWSVSEVFKMFQGQVNGNKMGWAHHSYAYTGKHIACREARMCSCDSLVQNFEDVSAGKTEGDTLILFPRVCFYKGIASWTWIFNGRVFNIGSQNTCNKRNALHFLARYSCWLEMTEGTVVPCTKPAAAKAVLWAVIYAWGRCNWISITLVSLPDQKAALRLMDHLQDGCIIFTVFLSWI